MSGCRFCVRVVLTALVFGIPAAASAQQRAAVPQVETASKTPLVIGQDEDAKETRQKLEELLRKLPPGVGRVLRIDPSLMGNENYLATYPVLAAFLKQHPEIRSNPAFFFERVGPYEFWSPSPPESREAQALRVWRDMLQVFGFGAFFVTMAFMLAWIVRTLMDQRRWNRTSKIHTEVHNKLMDRFTANEDLLAYMQTPAGRRFLESAPLSVDAPIRPVGAPLGRILWSVQVGVVLAAGAVGLLFVSNRVIDEVAQVFFAIGVLALAVGAGFVVSAAASFLLSRRLGLLEPAGVPREHTGITSQ
jgi:hypothetical protein